MAGLTNYGWVGWRCCVDNTAGVDRVAEYAQGRKCLGPVINTALVNAVKIRVQRVGLGSCQGNKKHLGALGKGDSLGCQECRQITYLDGKADKYVCVTV